MLLFYRIKSKKRGKNADSSSDCVSVVVCLSKNRKMTTLTRQDLNFGQGKRRLSNLNSQQACCLLLNRTMPMSLLLLLRRQWLQTSCASSWRSPYISYFTCVRSTPLGYFRRGKSTMSPCRWALVDCSSHLVYKEGSTFKSYIRPAAFFFFLPDVMSPRAEPVYSGYSSLCEASH